MGSKKKALGSTGAICLPSIIMIAQGLEKTRFFRKKKFLGFLGGFKVFLGFFRFQCPDTKFPPRKTILYTILSGRVFSVKYNKTHK